MNFDITSVFHFSLFSSVSWTSDQKCCAINTEIVGFSVSKITPGDETYVLLHFLLIIILLNING